jgi:hypothetical protein
MNIAALQSSAGPATPQTPSTSSSDKGVLAASAIAAGSLVARGDKVGVVGLTSAYINAVRTDARFVGEVAQLMKAHDVPINDVSTLRIVSALHFLENIAPSGLGKSAGSTMSKVVAYAHDKLQNFLSAYRSNAMSGGVNPPDPVVANLRNEALYMVDKYFGTDDLVLPNVKQDREPLKGEVGI